MPKTEVVFFREDNGSAPVLDWIGGLPAKVQDKVLVRVERLMERGYELRRPEADFLRDDIYELRIRHMRVNYRALYFFHDRCAVLSDGIEKKEVVSDADIRRSVDRRDRYRLDPAKHTYVETMGRRPNHDTGKDNE